MPDDSILIFSARAPEPSDVLAVTDTDRYGRILFREDLEVSTIAVSKIRATLTDQLSKMREIIDAATSGLGDLHVQEITLKFGIDKKLGCALIAQVGVQAAIEIKLQLRAEQAKA
jgi:hypothetical protein